MLLATQQRKVAQTAVRTNALARRAKVCDLLYPGDRESFERSAKLWVYFFLEMFTACASYMVNITNLKLDDA